MKKLVSLLSAVAMLAMLAVPASAALNYEADEDGWYVISEMPSDADIAAYTPHVATSVEKLETEEDLAAASSAVKKSFKSKLATHDIYKVTYTVTGIGDLVNGYNGDYGNAWFTLAALEVSYDPANLPSGYETKVLTYAMPGVSGDVKLGIGSQGVFKDKLNVQYSSSGPSYGETYPLMGGEEGTAVEDCTYVGSYVIAFTKTSETITMPFVGAAITYQKNLEGNPMNTSATGDAIVFGSAPVTPDPEPVVPTYELVKEYDLASGYGWDVVIKNFDSEKTYTAKFTNLDDAEDTRPTATINGLANIAETDGDVAFAALIRLTNGRSNIKFEIEIQ